jgi:nitroreductase
VSGDGRRTVPAPVPRRVSEELPLDKLITPAFPIHDLHRKRWSPRAFADKAVAPDVLASLLEAARWSPSSNNEQPWAFVVATKDDQGGKADPAGYDRLLGTLVEKNQQWAKAAPVLMIGLARKAFARNGVPNKWHAYDLGQAVAHLTVEATARGLFVHQMAGFDPDKARTVLGIPAEYEPMVAIAVGYLGDVATLPDDLRARETAPSTRKPQAEFVFAGKWGEPLG